MGKCCIFFCQIKSFLLDNDTLSQMELGLKHACPVLALFITKYSTFHSLRMKRRPSHEFTVKQESAKKHQKKSDPEGRI